MNIFREFKILKVSESYVKRHTMLSHFEGKRRFDENELKVICEYLKKEYKPNSKAAKITLEAFEKHDLFEKLKILKRLAGMDMRFAAAILSFQNPRSYAEINLKTWKVLKNEFDFEGEQKDINSDFLLEEYEAYLEKLNEIATEYGLRIADIEYVLSVSK